jgi:hypothetical protein
MNGRIPNKHGRVTISIKDNEEDIKASFKKLDETDLKKCYAKMNVPLLTSNIKDETAGIESVDGNLSAKVRAHPVDRRGYKKYFIISCVWKKIPERD